MKRSSITGGAVDFVASVPAVTRRGEVHPIALQLLAHMKMPTEGLRSKSWDEFAVPGSPHLDFVFTVCDNAAGEMCPYWPGQPITAHWGSKIRLPSKARTPTSGFAFRKTLSQLESRIKIFTSLPFETLDRIKLQEHLDAIGKTTEGKNLMIRRLFAEALGSLLLAATVIGSGIMAERLAEGKHRGCAAREHRSNYRGVGGLDLAARADQWRALQSCRVPDPGDTTSDALG